MFGGAHLACYFCIDNPDFNPSFTLPQRRPLKHSRMNCNPSLRSTLQKAQNCELHITPVIMLLINSDVSCC